MNNEVMATQASGTDPRTLEDAVQYPEDKYGEYGEDRRIMDWSLAKQWYCDVPGAEDTSRKRKEVKVEMAVRIDWG
ncbi:unnamed protein product [Phytophthora fragariaefolia]|uniref:Unnamed protein product n=1 Tax=Phytophthora fragariaefolia TaxID=1490495 RepID=A0A9W6Y086_9STRA|nr:unnamed protein product [Phytophthora fragariaefolia]